METTLIGYIGCRVLAEDGFLLGISTSTAKGPLIRLIVTITHINSPSIFPTPNLNPTPLLPTRWQRPTGCTLALACSEGCDSKAGQAGAICRGKATLPVPYHHRNGLRALSLGLKAQNSFCHAVIQAFFGHILQPPNTTCITLAASLFKVKSLMCRV